jgi:signal transduction histidine kinase
LWVGTGRGLNRLDPATGSFRRIPLDGRLDDARIYSMLEDDQGRLWISTPNALVRYHEDEGGAVIRVYETADGLQDGQFIRGSAYQCRHGEMFFGGTAGITSFYPDRVDDNPIVPPVAVVSFRIANKEVTLPTAIEETRTIEVEHEDNVLTFAFAAMEYTAPSKNQFAHRLEGFNADWTYAGTDRYATYTNLDPGRYTLRAKAANNDGKWGRETTLLTLIVHPPYWGTWWFRTLIGLSVLGFVGVLIYRREVHLRILREAQEDFSKRLIAEQEGERQRIAAELHDGLGQNILIMKNKALLAVQRFRPARGVKKELEGISDLASQTLEDARRISRNLRPYLLDRFGLTEALREMVEAIRGTSPLRWEMEIEPIDHFVPPAQQINVYRVVQEALTNVVRHADATEAVVRIVKEDRQIIIDVRDNGRGMGVDPASGRSTSGGGFGIAGIRERIRALEGTVEYRSASGSGTWLIITIPVRHETDHSGPHR